MPQVKILLCHNHYQQRGGEDQSFEDERRLLEQHGHDVLSFTVHNDEIKGMGGSVSPRARSGITDRIGSSESCCAKSAPR
jgi:hypothetical protein